jgi:speckle-type POZ protein
MSALIRALSPGPSSSRSGSTTTSVAVRVKENSSESESHLKDLSTDLCDLFSKSTLTDAVVYAEGQPIHTHKALLAARSVIFQSMFERIARENRPNVILINDLPFEVVNQMITFMYSGKVDQVSLELLAAAERYEIRGLKKICSSSIIKKLSVSTAIDTLITAHVNKCFDLEAAAVKFVASHWKNVRREETFSHLQNWPQILIKIIDTMAKV